MNIDLSIFFPDKFVRFTKDPSEISIWLDCLGIFTSMGEMIIEEDEQESFMSNSHTEKYVHICHFKDEDILIRIPNQTEGIGNDHSLIFDGLSPITRFSYDRKHSAFGKFPRPYQNQATISQSYFANKEFGRDSYSNYKDHVKSNFRGSIFRAVKGLKTATVLTSTHPTPTPAISPATEIVRRPGPVIGANVPIFESCILNISLLLNFIENIVCHTKCCDGTICFTRREIGIVGLAGYMKGYCSLRSLCKCAMTSQANFNAAGQIKFESCGKIHM